MDLFRLLSLGNADSDSEYAPIVCAYFAAKIFVRNKPTHKILHLIRWLICHTFFRSFFFEVPQFEAHQFNSAQHIKPVNFRVAEELHLRKGKRTISGYFLIDRFPTRESIRLRFTTKYFASYNFAAVEINIHNYNFVTPRANNERFVTVTEKFTQPCRVCF